MMVVDTVHSSGVGLMHGQTRRMKIIRPLHSFQGSEAEGSILSTSAVDKKGTTVKLDSRPSLVIRRRIMVQQWEEADDARCYQRTPALSNQPKSSTTNSMNHPQGRMDCTARHCDIIALPSSFASTKDHQVSESTAPMTKPPKTLHLFDLNKLPPTLPDSLSPIASPTATIDSADSATGVTTDASTMATRASAVMANTDVLFSSSPSIKSFRDEACDVRNRGGALAVDLGLLPTSLEITCGHNVEDSSMQRSCGNESAFQEPECTDTPTPARKRLRKLSEYVGGHVSSSQASMAKSWTIDGGEVCNRRDVTKTLASPQGETKVRGRDVDDEVLGAVSALLILSSSKKGRREFPFSSTADGSSTFLDEEEGREAGRTPLGSDLAGSETTSSRSLGSGGSVLSRPSNKQRYRSMAELMAQTPILRRV